MDVGAPNLTARIAGLFYLGTIVAGAMAAMSANGREANTLISAGCYVVVTLIFYVLFKPVNQGLSLLAAIASLAGCSLTFLDALHRAPAQLNPLAFFGVYCLLIGYLIFKSTFLPRFLGVLMAIGGIGWLTFIAPSLAKHLVPFNMLPGVLGESVLTLWLLIKGVNVQRWNAQSGGRELLAR